MGNYARVGVLCLMGLAIVLARLVEVEFRPGVQATPSMAVGAEPDPPAATATAPNQAAGALGAGAVGANALAPTPLPPPPAKPERIHVAKPGETLGAISAKVYRTSRKWKLIYDANRDVIPGPPESLRAGTQLKIPEPR